MERKDNLRRYMQELPVEQLPPDFSRKVMERVLLETRKSPAAYHPLISAKGWSMICIGLLALAGGITLVGSRFPGQEAPTGWQSLFQVDLSFLSKPFQALAGTASHLSLTLAAGLFAFTLLLLADQFYMRFFRR